MESVEVVDAYKSNTEENATNHHVQSTVQANHTEFVEAMVKLT